MYVLNLNWWLRSKERQKRNYSVNSAKWHRQNQFQVVRNFSVKCKIVRLLEDSLGEFFPGFRTRNNSLNRKSIYHKNDTIDLMKIKKNLCSSKDTLKTTSYKLRGDICNTYNPQNTYIHKVYRLQDLTVGWKSWIYASQIKKCD